ncbi:monocarboxylate transporter 14 [Caerostris extrusa]|uniref:Monocarboxylate transporter 14 n=1 Tax=Caerostris extrusa TaxID=172846 RepID=A0AAV4S1Q6_CAEEX|nr:monocarboxylate transporter 14 [Caerostris extrusa]
MINDEYWGWVIVFTTFIIHMIIDGLIYTFAVFYVEFLDYFKTTAGKASTVVSVFVGVSYCFGRCWIRISLLGFSNKYSNVLEKNIATAVGISMAGSGIGTLIFAPLMEWLINYYKSWKGAVLIATGLLLNCLVLSLFYRDPIGNKEDSEENHSNNQNSNDSSRRYHLDSLNSEDAVQQGNKQNSFEIEKKSKETLPSKQNFVGRPVQFH